MGIDFIDSRHPLYQAVKKLGRKYAATLGFMPDGGFEDYAARKNIITASEDGVLQGYLTSGGNGGTDTVSDRI